MTLAQWLLIVIMGIPLIFVIANRLRMDLAAILMALLLGILQLIGLPMFGPAHTPQAAIHTIAGFSQPVVITLLSLFILTRGLEKSGVTRWIAHHVIRLGGNDEPRLITLFTTVTALLSLLMNNVAAGALILPSALETAAHTHIKPSKLLIPIAYGSLLGGAATYFTTANIIMSDLLKMADPPQSPLSFLDFTPIGGLIAISGILFLFLFGKKLLPNREPPPQPPGDCTTNTILVKPHLAALTIPITLIAVAASIVGVPVYISMLSAAVLTLLLKILSMEEAYQVIEWQSIFVIIGMYAVSLAIIQTGLADLLSQNALAWVKHFGPIGVAISAYLLAVLLNQFIGGQVTAYVVGPIAIGAAIHMGANAQAVAVATAIGCSSSFLTPMAHPVNILMIAPANYKFTDFFKVGWPLTIISFMMLWVGLEIILGHVTYPKQPTLHLTNHPVLG